MPVIAMGPAPSGPTSSRSRVHDASAVQNKFPNNGDRVPSTRGMLVYDIPGTEKPSAVKHAPSRQRKPPKTTVAGGQPESTRMSRASLTSGGSSTIAAARPKSKDNRTDPGTTAEANRKITNAPRLVIVAPGPQAGLGEPGALDRNTSSRSLSPAPRNGHTASPRSAATEAREPDYFAQVSSYDGTGPKKRIVVPSKQRSPRPIMIVDADDPPRVVSQASTPGSEDRIVPKPGSEPDALYNVIPHYLHNTAYAEARASRDAGAKIADAQIPSPQAAEFQPTTASVDDLSDRSNNDEHVSTGPTSSVYHDDWSRNSPRFGPSRASVSFHDGTGPRKRSVKKHVPSKQRRPSERTTVATSHPPVVLRASTPSGHEHPSKGFVADTTEVNRQTFLYPITTASPPGSEPRPLHNGSSAQTEAEHHAGAGSNSLSSRDLPGAGGPSTSAPLDYYSDISHSDDDRSAYNVDHGRVMSDRIAYRSDSEYDEPRYPSRMAAVHSFDGTGPRKRSTLNYAPSKQPRPSQIAVVGGQPQVASRPSTPGLEDTAEDVVGTTTSTGWKPAITPNLVDNSANIRYPGINTTPVIGGEPRALYNDIPHYRYNPSSVRVGASYNAGANIIAQQNFLVPQPAEVPPTTAEHGRPTPQYSDGGPLTSNHRELAQARPRRRMRSEVHFYDGTGPRKRSVVNHVPSKQPMPSQVLRSLPNPPQSRLTAPDARGVASAGAQRQQAARQPSMPASNHAHNLASSPRGSERVNIMTRLKRWPLLAQVFGRQDVRERSLV